jgi:hypothetical protein
LKCAVLGSGEFFVVPRVVEHRPVASEGCEIIMFEPAGTLHTGNSTDSGITTDAEWI